MGKNITGLNNLNQVDKWIVLGCWQFYCCEVHNYVTAMISQQKFKVHITA